MHESALISSCPARGLQPKRQWDAGIGGHQGHEREGCFSWFEFYLKKCPSMPSLQVHREGTIFPSLSFSEVLYSPRGIRRRRKFPSWRLSVQRSGGWGPASVRSSCWNPEAWHAEQGDSLLCTRRGKPKAQGCRLCRKPKSSREGPTCSSNGENKDRNKKLLVTEEKGKEWREGKLGCFTNSHRENKGTSMTGRHGVGLILEQWFSERIQN